MMQAGCSSNLMAMKWVKSKLCLICLKLKKAITLFWVVLFHIIKKAVLVSQTVHKWWRLEKDFLCVEISLLWVLDQKSYLWWTFFLVCLSGVRDIKTWIYIHCSRVRIHEKLIVQHFCYTERPSLTSGIH